MAILGTQTLLDTGSAAASTVGVLPAAADEVSEAIAAMFGAQGQQFQAVSSQVAAGKIGESPAPAGTAFEVQVNAMGRLSDPQQFDDIVIRAGTSSEATLRLRDVGRTELGALHTRQAPRLTTSPPCSCRTRTKCYR